jgi:hypothetical protein
MRFALYRQSESAISTMGELFVDGKHNCWTLERPPGPIRIPAGHYPITLYPSPHFGRIMPLLNDIPERSSIEIHWGNVPGASEGCILIGKQKGEDTIFFTRAAFDELFPLIQNAIENTAEGCSIDIFDVPLSTHEDVQDAVTAT